MARRTVASLLWFASLYLACEVLWSVAATPRALNVVIATAVAVFVFVDPLRTFHPRLDGIGQPVPTVPLIHDTSLIGR